MQTKKKIGKDRPEVGDIYECAASTRGYLTPPDTHDRWWERGRKEIRPGAVVMVISILNREASILVEEKVLWIDIVSLMHMFHHAPMAN